MLSMSRRIKRIICFYVFTVTALHGIHLPLCRDNNISITNSHNGAKFFDENKLERNEKIW